MTAKAILTARSQSFKFTDRSLELDIPNKIGRAYKNEKAESKNGYFDCKVLSKAHALILYEDSKFFLLDTGSSNGTFINNIRLSKAGQESDLTEIFTGDILRFGSDVVDKSRNVTQKSVVMKIQLLHPSGEQHDRRSSQSRLYRPSDSYEDVSVVTKNLQTSLSRERVLEEKLIRLKNIIVENSEEMNFQTFLTKLKKEMNNIYEDIQPAKILHDEKKMDKVMKDNKELVMKCKEIEIRLDSKEKACLNLQEKSAKDEQHIDNLGSIIDKLKLDIGKLQTVIDTVKKTQEKVRYEYEETLMKQRTLFDDEIIELTANHKQETESSNKKARDEKIKMEKEITQQKNKLESTGNICWSSCSSQASISDMSTSSPSVSRSTERSVSSASLSSTRTVLQSLNKFINYKGETEVEDIEDFDLEADLDKSWELFNGMLKTKDDEIDKFKLRIEELETEGELIQIKENQNIELKKLAENQEGEIAELTDFVKKNARKLAQEREKIKLLEQNTTEIGVVKAELAVKTQEKEELEEQFRETQIHLEEARDDILSLEDANGRLKGQVMGDMIGLTEAIHYEEPLNDRTDEEDDSDSDTLTMLDDDDNSECDVFLDDLQSSSDIEDPS